MAVETSLLIINFIIALIVSGVVIYIATKLFGESEGFGTALLAAFIGTIIYTIAYYLLGNGMIAALIGGIAWLIALGSLYKMGWLKAFVVALVIWVISVLVSLVLPTLTGPI